MQRRNEGISEKFFQCFHKPLSFVVFAPWASLSPRSAEFGSQALPRTRPEAGKVSLRRGAGVNIVSSFILVQRYGDRRARRDARSGSDALPDDGSPARKADLQAAAFEYEQRVLESHAPHVGHRARFGRKARDDHVRKAAKPILYDLARSHFNLLFGIFWFNV